MPLNSTSVTLQFSIEELLYLWLRSKMVDAAIKFNDGGAQFEVSRALIDDHSDTVLGRLASDTSNDDSNKPVFVDRDGNILAHVLNYLSYVRQVCPACVVVP